MSVETIEVETPTIVQPNDTATQADNDVQFDLNDMYIEDVDMFDQLDDVEDTGDKPDPNAMGQEHVDAKDLVDEEDLEEEDEEDSEEEEVDEDEEDDEEEEVEVEGDAEEEDDSPEEEEVDFEEYEVTLPSGEIVKLNEAIKGYRAASELEAEREAFEQEKESFTESTKSIDRRLNLAKLEAERVIEDYEDFDWATLSREDPKAYVENREFLDRYRVRHKEIQEEMDQMEADKLAEEKASFQAKAKAASDTLAKEIPGWGKDAYIGLMTYAVKTLGYDEKEIIKVVDPAVFRAIHKAKMLDEGKQTVKAKIKRTSKSKSPTKVVKPAASKNKTGTGESGKKAILTKRLASGNYSDKDFADAFNMLDD